MVLVRLQKVTKTESLTVKRRNQRWVDHTGLNLIRLIIGSYFMAISLGLIQGVDHRAIFAPTLGLQVGDLIGTTTLFAISAAFMSGLYLRGTSLLLALFVLASSIIENFIPFQPQNISAFWRDLTLMCGALLSYYSLQPTDMQRASLVGRRYISGVVKTSEQVTPRRVVTSDAAKARTADQNRKRRHGTGELPQPTTLADQSPPTPEPGNPMDAAMPPYTRGQIRFSNPNRRNADQKRKRRKPTHTAVTPEADVTNIFVES